MDFKILNVLKNDNTEWFFGIKYLMIRLGYNIMIMFKLTCGTHIVDIQLLFHVSNYIADFNNTGNKITIVV